MVIAIAAGSAGQVLEAMIVQLPQKAGEALVSKELGAHSLFENSRNTDPKRPTMGKPRDALLVFGCGKYQMELLHKTQDF